MIKSLALRFFSAFSTPTAQKEADRLALVEAQKLFQLKGSERERLAATKEWSKPENIANRLKEFEVQAAKALDMAIRLRKVYEVDETPLPDPLPEEFKGQQPSTIRAILRQRRDNEHAGRGHFGRN